MSVRYTMLGALFEVVPCPLKLSQRRREGLARRDDGNVGLPVVLAIFLLSFFSVLPMDDGPHVLPTHLLLFILRAPLYRVGSSAGGVEGIIWYFQY